MGAAEQKKVAARFGAGILQAQKWHTSSTTGYFSPYISILHMINNSTHRKIENKNKKISSTSFLRFHTTIIGLTSLPSACALHAVVLICWKLNGSSEGKGAGCSLEHLKKNTDNGWVCVYREVWSQRGDRQSAAFRVRVAASVWDMAQDQMGCL